MYVAFSPITIIPHLNISLICRDAKTHPSFNYAAVPHFFGIGSD